MTRQHALHRALTSVQNFRSITKAYKLPIARSTVLVGPNNEGKSNILKALVTAMQILTEGRRRLLRPGATRPMEGFFARGIYDWERDFPIAMQESKPNGQSILTLEFQLTDDEVSEFRESIKSKLNGTLPIKIALSQRKCEVTVAKKGRGGKALTNKSQKIAEFVAERLDFDYIPAVRTAQSAQEVVDQLVERELRAVERNPEYKDALAKVAEIQQPILDDLSSSIRETLVEFLPAIDSVTVQISESTRYRALRRSTEIIVDDGTPTELRYKGDGAQSLAALGVMRHASERGARGRNLIIAIEEPESHLHPNAIHALRNVVYELAEKHQVVLTTHCPLFVERSRIESNIIVNNKKATTANSIDEIRNILGVRASDNLQHAELVLLVEGEDDRLSMEALLGHASDQLRECIKDGTLAIDTLAGGSNLAYKTGLIRDALCDCHCFLDDDASGRSGFETARVQGLLTDADVHFAVCPRLDEAEIEDLYDKSIYAGMLLNAYRVSIESPKFKGKNKWSDRLKLTFQHQGKGWSDRIEAEVKRKVAEIVATSPNAVLNPHRRGAFDALVTTLETRISARS